MAIFWKFSQCFERFLLQLLNRSLLKPNFERLFLGIRKYLVHRLKNRLLVYQSLRICHIKRPALPGGSHDFGTKKREFPIKFGNYSLCTGMHGYLQKCNCKSKNVNLSVLWPEKLSFKVKKFKNSENWAHFRKKHASILPYYWMCIKLHARACTGIFKSVT